MTAGMKAIAARYRRIFPRRPWTAPVRPSVPILAIAAVIAAVEFLRYYAFWDQWGWLPGANGFLLGAVFFGATAAILGRDAWTRRND